MICGPTAAGKTKLAYYLAGKFNGEIISVDSRQVYRYMDIGTGKDLNTDFKTWGVDLVDPDQDFSVAEFLEFTHKVIEGIWKRKKLPIIVGGTAFWLKALLDGVDTAGIPPDWNSRSQLNSKSVKTLSRMLKTIDVDRWQRMNQSDRNNPRRLIRAIEIARYKIANLIRRPAGQMSKKKRKYNTLLVGLKVKNYKTLYKKIDDRVEKRIKQGAQKEVNKLLKMGYTWDLPSFSASGYRVWKEYFQYKKSLAEVIQRWKYDEHGLARRQMTFFKNIVPRDNWFYPEDKDLIAKRVRLWYIKT